MNETPAGLLLFGVTLLVLLFISILVMLLIYLARARGRKPSASSGSSPPPAASSPPPQAPLEPERERPARSDEVMSVIRDQESGRVLVEVDGQRYAHIREIRDAGVGRRVLWAIADLVRFTGGMATNPQAVQSAREAEAGPADGRASQSRTVLAGPSSSPAPPSRLAPPDRLAQRLSGLTSLGTTEPPATQQSYGLIDYFRRGFQAPQPTEAVPSPTAFIEEIDEILQRMIRELPTPPSQPVRVTSGEDGMLQIIVGIQAYRSADEVPDAQIRRLIRAAVAEWERS